MPKYVPDRGDVVWLDRGSGQEPGLGGAHSAKYQAKADPGVVQEVRAKLAVLI